MDSLVPLKQLSSTPMQGRVALQVPARLSLELAQAGHSFPFAKRLGTTDREGQDIKNIESVVETVCKGSKLESFRSPVLLAETLVTAVGS